MLSFLISCYEYNLGYLLTEKNYNHGVIKGEKNVCLLLLFLLFTLL